MYTLEECENNWIETGAHSTPAKRIARSRSWLEYYAYLAVAEQAEPYHYNGKLNPVICDLLSMGVLRTNDHVVDIGAGTGNYTLDMAKHSAGVTALEPCAETLETLQYKAGIRHVQNVDCVNSFWEEFCPERE